MALAPALDLRRAPREDGESESVAASLEAEQALLGVLLYEPEVIRTLRCELRAEHFHEPFHGRLFQAISEWIAAGDTPDPTLLAEEFRSDPAYRELGAGRYFADLIDRAPPAARAADYATHILDLHGRRRLLDLSNQIARAVREGAADSATIIAEAEREIAAIRNAQAEVGTFVTARRAATEALEEIERESLSGRPRGPSTGLRCFDARLGGLVPKRLMTIGGRPGMGKTAMLRSCLYGAASLNPHRTFALFSWESPNREISERAIAAATVRHLDPVDARSAGGGVQTMVLNRSNVGITEMPTLRSAVETLPENLFLFDDASMGLGDIIRTVWALKAKGALAAIGIDYVQLIKRPHAKGRTDAAEIGDITTAMKQLCMDAEICGVLVSQLNRGVDSRDDKRPVLGDLRESGSIEQDSDIVQFPYREAYYLERAEPAGGTPQHTDWEVKLHEVRDLMEVATAKFRQGKLGTDRQLYLPEFDAISDWTRS